MLLPRPQPTPKNYCMNFNWRAAGASTTEIAAITVALEPAFDFSGAEYRALHANSDATVFQSPAWLDALHRDVAPHFGAAQATLTARDQDGRLMMVLPFVRRRQHGLAILSSDPHFDVVAGISRLSW